MKKKQTKRKKTRWIIMVLYGQLLNLMNLVTPVSTTHCKINCFYPSSYTHVQFQVEIFNSNSNNFTLHNTLYIFYFVFTQRLPIQMIMFTSYSIHIGGSTRYFRLKLVKFSLKIEHTKIILVYLQTTTCKRQLIMRNFSPSCEKSCFI